MPDDRAAMRNATCGREGSEDRKIDWLLFMPLFLGSIFVQFVIPTVRIATSYRAVELELSLAAIGVISATYALLPVFVALPFGRLNDRGAEAVSALLGSALILVSCAALWCLPASFIGLIVITGALGFGHTLFSGALQVVATRCSGPAARDRVLGNYMVALSLGTALGPLLLSMGDARDLGALASWLFMVSTGASFALVAAAVWFLALRRHAVQTGTRTKRWFASILETPRLVPVLIASSITVTANDLVLIYLPVIGAERAISPATIGILLSARAVTAMASRFFFAGMVRVLGRARLLVIMMFIAAASTAGFAADAPVWVMFACSVLSGFSLGIATTASLSLTVAIAPVSIQATVLSIRITSTRVGQFLIPLGAGFAASLLGTGIVFVLIGAALGLSGLSLRARPTGD